MDSFQYHQGVLHCEDVDIPSLAAKFGTPLYVYSESALVRHLKQIQDAFAEARPIICYSVKANGNLAIGQLMAKHGAGFDVTSGGELYRAIKAGGPKSPIVFAGVGKTDAEIRYGLESGVLLFDVESEEELHRLGEIAHSMGKVANAALRVNPALPPKTHVKTDTSVKGTKFGLDIETILDVARGVVGKPGLSVNGLHMHLGSPIYTTQPYKEGAEKGVKLIAEMRKMGHPVKYLNMGGGFGINYRKDEARQASEFAEVILPAWRETGCQLVLEPGRFIVGNAGILVTRVVFNKESGGKRFIIQDGGMNDLIRPTLYESFHKIWPVQPKGFPIPPDDFEADIPGTKRYDVVGPVCESGDFLAKDRQLPAVKRGDLLAVFSAGAYGMSMASNYNGRPRPAEVLVTASKHRLIRRRETYEDLVAAEIDLS